uniref:Uncharacterized protein n=1 Tax=Glossina pallidipes TaxID=7398 RepID=A0A1B0A1P9_GLOPL
MIYATLPELMELIEYIAFLFYNGTDEFLLGFCYENPGCHWQPALQALKTDSDLEDSFPVENLQKHNLENFRLLEISNVDDPSFLYYSFERTIRLDYITDLILDNANAEYGNAREHLQLPKITQSHCGLVFHKSGTKVKFCAFIFRKTMNCSEASGNQPTIVQEEDGDQTKMAKTAELEEEKLKRKYPIDLESSSGHTAFLQKRLQKGQKFFDSGDYQMAKQRCDDMDHIFADGATTGELIPTPETVPVRKTSIIQFCNKFQTPN